MNPSEPPQTTTETTDPALPDAIRWSAFDESELIHAYWRYVAPTLRSNGYDPETHRPTHNWLRSNGFRPLLYTLRENHNTTFTTFWNVVLGLEPQDEPDYNWEITHSYTIELLEAYLEGLNSRGELAETTVKTLRYRLAKYVRAYAAANNTGDLITPIKRGAGTPQYEAVDACIAAFDVLHEDIESNATKERVYRAVYNWYAHLVRRKRAAFNPVEGLDEEYKWQLESTDTPSLAPGHITTLFEAAETSADKLLVVALAGWGLRSSEVAALHRSQLVVPEDASETPYVAFEERKNGPGEVSILYGLPVYQNRVAELVASDGEWGGYLFPSTASESGHITRDTVLNRFDRLVSATDIPDTIHGEKPVPKMARRFWYDAYSAVLDDVFEGIEGIAEEQGSRDASVVLENYLSDGRVRQLRRKQMQQRLAEAFGEVSTTPDTPR